MVATDFMIGDWLERIDNGQKFRVDLDFYKLDKAELEQYKPIHLTDDILKRNLEIAKDPITNKEYFAIYNGLIIKKDTRNGYILNCTSFGNLEVTNKVTYLIHYVHDLQHWLKILNYNKNITL